jgi:TonB family protein
MNKTCIIKLLCSVPCVFFAICAHCQSIDTIYRDFAGKITPHKNAAVYYSIEKREGDNNKVSQYLINGTLLLEGVYTPDALKNGYFKEYSYKGCLEKEGAYIRDKENGEWHFYFNDCKTIKCKKFYYESDPVVYVEYYDSLTGKKILEGSSFIDRSLDFNNEFRTGTWTLRYLGTDRICRIATYEGGRLTGDCKFYDSASTNLLSEGKLIDGKRAGRWKIYNPLTKKILAERDYIDGKYHGVYIRYDSVKSMKQIAGQYVNGKHEGEWLFYHPGTNKIAGRTMYKNGKMEGEEIEYDSMAGFTTIKGSNVNGKRTGLWTFYFPGTTRVQSQVYYKNGFYDGVATIFDSLTGLKYAEGKYNQGKITGKWKYYHKGSEILRAEKNFTDGVPDGVFAEFDSTGFKYSVLNYKDGKRHGEWKVYFNDIKTKWFHARFENGVLDGKLETFYPTGNKRRIEIYDKGKQLSGKCFEQDGSEIQYYPFVIEPDYVFDVMNYIANNVRYPLSAENGDVDGEVLVGFVVDEFGKVKNVEVTKGIGNGFDEEAIRVISGMHKWRPMYIDGVPTSSYLQTPVRFAKREYSEGRSDSLKEKDIQ